ncbi:MAG: hypothetical protein DRJ28_00725 [Actinobacteria bacterium]|nr:MAG: hypothetical protein DRJ28_00725 [Actinomycetota bacterium]
MESSDATGAQATSHVRNRAVAVLGGFGVVAILVALAYVFSTSSSAQQVATNAQELHEANASAGSAAIARASIAQAVVFSIDYELGVASTDARDAALTEATSTLEGTRRWVEALTANPDTTDLGAELGYLVDTGDEVLDLLVAGGSIAAEQIRTASFEPLYATVANSLAVRQSEIVGEIHTTERFAGIVGWVTKFLATLLIPAAAIILYFFIVRRQIREARLKMDARLRAERKLGVAKDEFIAGISHELRTPLTSIYGFSEYLLENEILDPNEAMELIALINEDSAELSRMVDDLLTAARLESNALRFNYEYVDIRVESEAAIGAMVRAGTDVRVVGEVLAWADPVRVRQIVRNLVSNAIKHGGPSVVIYLEEVDDHTIITVSDNGEGLSSDIQKRLFDRFVHDGNETLLTGSVGLGLSIARSLAQTMGGEIRFVRAGGLTNFEVSLPRKADVPIDTRPTERTPVPQRTAGSDPVLV